MIVLGIETSCDDTSVALVRGGRDVLSCVVTSQDEFHARFGGVVPEIASRRHLETIDEALRLTLEKAGVALDSVGGVAASQGPGLIGSLLVGLNFAKGLAYARGLPFVGVNHVEGHLFAARLGERPAEPPFVGLVVSGGHTNVYRVDENGASPLGRTVDDAAGECFDKTAKLLGLGFPGGVQIDRLARGGDPAAVDLPRPMLRSGDLRFSFSGLKTAVRTYVESRPSPLPEKELADLCASLNAAVVDVLVAKLADAATAQGVRHVVVAGGVAANTMLRERAYAMCGERGWDCFIPDFRLCTDNAAMIAAAGDALLTAGKRSDWSANAFASLRKGA